MQTIGITTAWRSLPPRQRLAVSLGHVASLGIGGVLAHRHCSVLLGAAGAAVGVLIGLAATVDLASARLPNRLVGAAAAATVVEIASDVASDVASALAGVALVVAVVVVARMVGVVGFGGGDIKLALVVGASTGVPIPAFAGVATAIAAASCLLSGSVSGRRTVAFGPCLWLGWVIAKSSTILTAATIRGTGADLYHLSGVASAELLQRAFTLGGGI